MKREDWRMHVRAQKLVRKFTEPNPFQEVPLAQKDDRLMEVWAWAKRMDRPEILSALARAVCRSLRYQGQRRLMWIELHALAEQAKADERWKEYADFTVALANLENNLQAVIVLYKEALQVYARLGDWAGEAACAGLAASTYRLWRRYSEAQQMSLRSFALWNKAQHKKGIGHALMDLAFTLEKEERFVEACLLLRKAKGLIHSDFHITARDTLYSIAGDHGITPEQYETRKKSEQLVLEIFGDAYSKVNT